MPPEPEPEREPEDDRYTLDDLVGHEKRQMRFLVAVLVIAALFLIGRKAVWERAGPDDSVAPVFSGG